MVYVVLPNGVPVRWLTNDPSSVVVLVVMGLAPEVAADVAVEAASVEVAFASAASVDDEAAFVVAIAEAAFVAAIVVVASAAAAAYVEVVVAILVGLVVAASVDLAVAPATWDWLEEVPCWAAAVPWLVRVVPKELLMPSILMVHSWSSPTCGAAGPIFVVLAERWVAA